MKRWMQKGMVITRNMSTNKNNKLKYVIIAVVVLAIIAGVVLVAGDDESLTEDSLVENAITEDNAVYNGATEESQTGSSEQELVAAPEFTLTDQYGVTHSLSDYRGRIVFLNFWGTWCPPCRAEMPDIQELYEEYSENEGSEMVILSVAFPGQSGETDVEGIKSFLDENGYSYPVLMDEEASLQYAYYITSFPTTFIINAEGYVLGYIPGSMTKDVMEDVIDQAMQMAK